MTCEEAVSFRIELLAGYRDKFDEYIEKELVKEDPLDSLTAELAFCGSDTDRIVSLLNDFVAKAADGEIDYDRVFGQLLRDLRELYFGGRKTKKELVELMSSFAGDKWLDGAPWSTMYYFEDAYWDAESGYLSSQYFDRCLNEFLSGNRSVDLWGEVKPKKSLLGRWIEKLKNRKK